MTRIEFISSDEYVRSTIELIINSKKPGGQMRQELSTAFIDLKNELIAHYTDSPVPPRTTYETLYDDETTDYIKGNEDGI